LDINRREGDGKTVGGRSYEIEIQGIEGMRAFTKNMKTGIGGGDMPVR
jgi:hypothetical protein